MAISNIKDASIIGLDAVPRIAPTTGKGASGYLREQSGHVVTVAADSQNSIYQLVRLPFSAKVKDVLFESAAQAAGTFDVGVYYATDGSNALSKTALLAADAIDQDFFATLIAVTSAVARTDITNESGLYTIDKREQPLWQALGLAADPGGNADICITIVTAITTGAARAGISVKYVD